MSEGDTLVEMNGRYATAAFWNMDAFEKHQYVSEKKDLPYRMLTPENYDKNKKYPLVLFLHGDGEKGSDNESQLKHFLNVFAQPSSRKNFPCFVVAPQCPKDEGWYNWPRKSTWVMSSSVGIVKSLMEQYNIDDTKVYVVGLVNIGCWEAILRYPDVFSGFVPISTSWKLEGSESRKLSDKSIWIFNGAKDPYHPIQYTDLLLLDMRRAGFKKMRYSIYEDEGIWAWVNASNEPDLLSWMVSGD
jgi:predicted peptidase